jgi:uncharacterized flavoprotein (TIGR03862 family)
MRGAVIIGGGPTGLFAAERLTKAGIKVDLYDKKERPGRKFLLAGQSGLNISNGEEVHIMAHRYGRNSSVFRSFLDDFSPQDLRSWLSELDVETFIGNGGKVFPRDKSAREILDAWLERLDRTGLFTFHPRFEWTQWEGNSPVLQGEGERIVIKNRPLLFALGGASWPETGSNGSWAELFSQKTIAPVPFKPMNCAFFMDWSDRFDRTLWNHPVKNIALICQGETKRGDMLITERGIEGGPVYWFSLPLREALDKNGKVTLFLDLMPDLSRDMVKSLLEKKSVKKSLVSFLKGSRRLSLEKIALLMERSSPEDRKDTSRLADIIKMLPLELSGYESLERAISSSGGVDFTSLDESLMIKELPGLFVAGEMVDWEAPTGGYMLQGCFAMANRATRGMEEFY